MSVVVSAAGTVAELMTAAHRRESGHVSTEETRTKPKMKFYVLKLRKNHIENNFCSRTQPGLTGFVQVIST